MKKRTKKVLKDRLPFIIAAISLSLGGLLFIYRSLGNEPITREEAIVYSGNFVKYSSSKNYCGIDFEDDSHYSVHAHSEKSNFEKAMKALDRGTRLYILVNPNNEYVVEIKTDTQELLNFEKSQKAIKSSAIEDFVFGMVLCAISVIGTILVTAEMIHCICRNPLSVRATVFSASDGSYLKNSPILRRADPNVKNKVLLEARVSSYKICYRRVKSVNELVINGNVYSEKRGIIEFEHELGAIIDGHYIEAGLDGKSYSYILFDEKMVARKKRTL